MSAIKCPYCHEPLIRVHKGGEIYCSTCNEPLLRDVSPNDLVPDRYIKCGECGFDENINPRHGDKCPRCGFPIL